MHVHPPLAHRLSDQLLAVAGFALAPDCSKSTAAASTQQPTRPTSASSLNLAMNQPRSQAAAAARAQLAAAAAAATAAVQQQMCSRSPSCKASCGTRTAASRPSARSWLSRRRGRSSWNWTWAKHGQGAWVGGLRVQADYVGFVMALHHTAGHRSGRVEGAQQLRWDRSSESRDDSFSQQAPLLTLPTCLLLQCAGEGGQGAGEDS